MFWSVFILNHTPLQDAEFVFLHIWGYQKNAARFLFLVNLNGQEGKLQDSFLK